jgi:hypothetical protein
MSIFKNKDTSKTQAPEEQANPAAKAAEVPVRAAKKGLRTVDKRNKNLKTISIASTVLFLVILLVFNILFDNLLGDVLKWDWTTGSQYSIGDVSKTILGSMSQDVEIIGLFNEDADQNYQNILPMLDEYKEYGKGKLTVRYVDPDQTPAILAEVDPQSYLKPEAGSFVVTCKSTGKGKVVAYNDIFDIGYDDQYNSVLNGITAEQSFTGAIKYVQSETTPVIYFTTGHDEIDYTANYTSLERILKLNNYDVKPLDLFSLTAIPEDCSVLAMASPKKDITTAERKLISAYLQQGGSLLFITDFNTAAFPELNAMLIDYNLEISNNKIREGSTDYRLQDDPYILRAIAPANTISPREVDGWTLASNARGINELKNTKEWITVETVLTTSPDGYAETNGDPEQASAAGTQTLALLSDNRGYVDGTNVKNSAKVLVFGSSDLFGDTVLQTYGNQLYNAELFYLSVQWLSNTKDAESLYIEAKQPTSYAITRGSSSINVMTAVIVTLVLPGALLVAALFVYRKRKHL